MDLTGEKQVGRLQPGSGVWCEQFEELISIFMFLAVSSFCSSHWKFVNKVDSAKCKLYSVLNDREQRYLSACGWNFDMQALQLATPIPRVGLHKMFQRTNSQHALMTVKLLRNIAT